MPWTLIILAVAPALAICGYIFHKDRFEKEPRWLVVAAFGLGVFAVFPAVIASKVGERFINNDGSFINTTLFAFGVVALPEECVKFFFLRYVLYKRKEFNEPMDGIVYAVMIGMGFAAFENIFYVANSGWGVALVRMVTVVPAHAVFAIIMGYYVGLAKFDLTHHGEFMRKGLMYPVLLHGAYDFLLFQDFFPLLFIVAFAGVWIAAKKVHYLITASRNQSPFKDRE